MRTEYPGTAPEEVETLLSRPLEQELGIVPHLVNISSISKAGQSDIILEFEWDTDMNAMSQEIREKADRVWLPPRRRETPAAALRPFPRPDHAHRPARPA